MINRGANRFLRLNCKCCFGKVKRGEKYQSAALSAMIKNPERPGGKNPLTYGEWIFALL